MGPALHAQLLGDFRLSLHSDNGDVPILAVKATRFQTLLAYLLLHHHSPQSRQHVAFLLWPDSSEPQARTNLRHLIHLLRQSLPEFDDFLLTDNQTIQWLPDALIDVDVHKFEDALARGALEEAVHLYCGELLPGCYEDWVLEQRERLLQKFIHALEELVRRYEQEREYTTAIGSVQLLIHLDPLHEDYRRSLIRLYSLNDNRSAALRAYYDCATILQRELGVEPSPATQELYERLVSLHTDQEAAADSPLVVVFPLVDRHEAWEELLGAWRAAQTRGPQIVLLTGEVGIGKTRLVEEFLAWVTRQGIRSASTNCYSGESALVYAPVIAWVRAHPLPPLPPHWLTELSRLLPEIKAEHPDLTPPGPLREPCSGSVCLRRWRTLGWMRANHCV